MTNDEIKAEIKRLENSKTGNFIKDIEISDQIHGLTMRLNGVKSINQECSIDGSCENCGS